MIDVEGLTKSYRKGDSTIRVLKGVTFRIERGAFAAIMGPSGSGKSTLLNIFGLLDRADSGRYLLDGEDFSGAADDALSAARNRTIGFIFQQFHLLDRVSALRNAMLPLLYGADGVNDGEARAMHALDAVGLSQRAHHFPNEMSGGEQQRVAIARALINDPALILADEPTGNLDAQNGTEVLDIFRRLVDEGRTLVMVTHKRAVAEHADRILTLNDGRIGADEALQQRGPSAHEGASTSP